MVDDLIDAREKPVIVTATSSLYENHYTEKQAQKHYNALLQFSPHHILPLQDSINYLSL